MRHPEQALLQRGTAKLELLARAGHVGHHGRGFFGEQTEHGVLRGLDHQPRHRQHAKSQERLHAALEQAHAPAHLINPLHRVVNANRQHDGCQAKVVAQLVGVRHWAQVDRHHGANLLALDLITVCQQILPDGTGHAAHQHVVDGAVERLADRLDLFERDGLAPGDAFGGARHALEPRGGVIGHKHQCGGVGGNLVGHFGQIHCSVNSPADALLNAFLRVVEYIHGPGGTGTCHVHDLGRELG